MLPTGVLLAAGRATRFGSAKLLVPLRDGPLAGLPVAAAACRNLRDAIGNVIAVVRADDDALARMLAGEGARIVFAARADDGMGASLAAGVAAAPETNGCLVALADMPWIAPATIRAVADALARGASIVAPRYRGERGHPVGFSTAHRRALTALTGDQGAKSIIDVHRDALVLVDVDDAGTVRDVDTPDDLA